MTLSPGLASPSPASSPPGSHGPAHLEVEGLYARYSHESPWAVEDLSISVPEGCSVAVVGPNGSGKSTLFKAMVGLLKAEAGSVRVHGQPFGHDQNCVAYVPQREEVDWRFPVTVLDVVLMGSYGRLGWLRRPGKADREAAMANLAQLDVADLAGRSIGELSGGQQQRVFLARALAQEPHILLLDEPFTGIDAATQDVVLDLLDRLKAGHVTAIVATHDLELAASRFDRVLLLNRRVVAYGTPAEVFTPAHIAEAFGHHALYLGPGEAMLVDPAGPSTRAAAPSAPPGTA